MQFDKWEPSPRDILIDGVRRVTVGTSLNRCYDTDWNTAAIKEGESEPPEMIAIIERNREDRERQLVIDR
jgi:hypothetical protein